MTSDLTKSRRKVSNRIIAAISQVNIDIEKRGASLNSTIPTHEIPDKSSSAANHRIAGFRFTSEQRAVLEAEALRTGGTVDSSRRVELAKDLGVEEKTVRVRNSW
jgi:hypothetical protein